jgi:LuxR family maltose regulon positive regulatory protein
MAENNISGELTGRPSGERILPGLEEAGAFVVAPHACRLWFRYHQTFADLLQLELLSAMVADAAQS